jgi:hypothetical protein
MEAATNDNNGLLIRLRKTFGGSASWRRVGVLVAGGRPGGGWASAGGSVRGRSCCRRRSGGAGRVSGMEKFRAARAGPAAPLPSSPPPACRPSALRLPSPLPSRLAPRLAPPVPPKGKEGGTMDVSRQRRWAEGDGGHVAGGWPVAEGRALVVGAVKEGMVAEHAVVCAPLGMRNTFKDQG